ncbi:lipoyl(octanoyl) transferase LipB [Salinimonas marina]
MQDFTDTRAADCADEIWLVEHDAVFTQGQAGKAEHILMPGDIPVVNVDRGGQVTYHGPGQQVIYLMLDIKRRKLGVRHLVNAMENAVISLLGDFKILAYAKKDAPGVYVDEQKVCSLGLRIRRGCSFHGLALNVAMDLTPFERINPCGYAGMQMTDTQRLNGPETLAQAGPALIANLLNELDIQDTQYKEGFDE